MIVSTNEGGLSNRIKSIVSCLRYGKENNKLVKVYWPILSSYKTHNHILNCEYSKLFENKLEVKEIDENDVEICSPILKIFNEDKVPEKFCKYKPKWRYPRAYIPKDKLKRDIIFSYNEMPELAKQNYMPYFKKLKPIMKLQEKIDSFSKNFDKNTISIHIRSWCGRNEECRAKSLVVNIFEVFETEMSKYPNSIFFLSTDSTPVKKYFLNRSPFKNKIITYPRSTVLENSRSLECGVQEDLIELYLLSKNNIIIGSKNSTFTEVSWWLSNCTQNITII